MEEKDREFDNEQSEEYSFIREKIKDKPVNKKKMGYTALFVAVMAVLFGVIAAYVFTAVLPGAQEKLHPETPDQVIFPEDENTDDIAEVGGAEEPEQVIIQEKVSLELKDYEELFNKMSVLAASSSRSLVTVTSATSEVDWFDAALESRSQGTGAIIADNGLEYLILTERKLVAGADHISITFADGSVHEAAEKSYDGNTGLAVLAVPRKSLSQDTIKAAPVAVLGNSNLVQSGQPVIAAGSPLGFGNEAVFGNVTSQGNYVCTKDANYKILTTDIHGSTQGSGVLMNLKGEIVGIIAQDYHIDEEADTVVAFAVSGIKNVIEKMSNGGEIAYMGIMGSDVTPAIAAVSGMPRGIYVEVVMDSPAMRAGIQNGDIITAINNEPVENMRAIQNIMLDFEPEQALNLTIMRLGKADYVEMKYVVTLGKLN